MSAASLPVPLLEIRDLHLAMRSFDGEAHVLNGIDLTLRRGEIWGMVGETGCGKSLTGLSISRLVAAPPGRYLRGEIRFEGRNLLALSEREMGALRGRRIGMIFQDPTTNLNPLFTVGDQIVSVALQAARFSPEILGVAQAASPLRRRRAARAKAVAMLEKVGIADAAGRIGDYPHQFSGGMRQRVLIAMALIGQPDLLVADEPTTALDVSVQAQILALLHGLVQEQQLGVLFITHNLAVVAELCTHVAVMYAGNVVEAGPVRSVLRDSLHPYTRGLLASLPVPGISRGALRGLAGTVPDLLAPPRGCRFAPRCPAAQTDCNAGVPPMRAFGAEHGVACLHVECGRHGAA